jgi:acyl carrier protein
MSADPAASAVDASPDADRIAAWCIDYIANALGIPPDRIRPDDDFDSLGLDSAVTTAMVIDMESWLGAEIPLSVLFEQATLRDVAIAVARHVG